MDVDSPGFGAILIDGERFDHVVVVEAERAAPPSETRSRLSAAECSMCRGTYSSGGRLVVAECQVGGRRVVRSGEGQGLSP